MKKKILLFILMFAFMTNVSALTFNVDVTNIEDEGNGTLGEITNIDVSNKEVDALFQDIGDEVNFSITITNSGDRAGTLREITFEPANQNMEYTSNLPDGGLAINGNDTNKVIVKAKVKPGAQNGRTTSEVKIKYTYDEGSCPDGEILSDDESMCLCPEGMERNEAGICVKPEKPVECKDDEIYNETKKICEKKVVPVTPSNPKTLDNIILITLLFFVSGLGIYAVLFKKLKTKKQKVTAGIITGVTALTLSFTVLAGVFGLDNLLGAIINPITKSKELIVTVNEEIDLIETWDGDCDVTGALTPDNVFDGGSGTESDPYKIKTANQLACFAKSINEGTTYEGQYIKQIKSIKLNDDLNGQAASGDLSGANLWIPAGHRYYDDNLGENVIRTFAGQYDGDNNKISGLYMTNSVLPNEYGFKGLFGHATNATFKNMILSDVYVDVGGNTGALLGFADGNLTLDKITTYGTLIAHGWDGAGVVSNQEGNDVGIVIIENTTNNINLTCEGSCSGIIHRMGYNLNSNEPTTIFRNNTNNGNITYTSTPSIAGGLFGYVNAKGALVAENNVNTGKITGDGIHRGGNVGGIMGQGVVTTASLTDSYNTGDNESLEWCGSCGMLYGSIWANGDVTIDNSYNSGDYIPTIDLVSRDSNSYFGGIVGEIYSDNSTITNCFNTGDLAGNISYMAGIVAKAQGTIENCYNEGDLQGYGYVGGIFSYGEHMDITKTYNTGTITAGVGPMAGGIVGYSATNVSYSYNTGNLINGIDNVTDYNSGGMVGGICANYCNTVRNCYNTGNITAKSSPVDIGGITGYNMGSVTNVYNAGSITYTNQFRYGNSGYVAGISPSGGTVTNGYNLGDITYNLVSQPNGYEPNPHVDGIATYASANNCVNTGNLKLVVTEPLIIYHLIQMNGIAYNGASNSFNAGKIEIDDSALDTPISEDGLPHLIRIGQITESYNAGTGNKWNTDPTAHSIGCYGIRPQCTDEAADAVGIYVNEDTPDILSIINGDDAFEIKEGDTLPTLKIFNN
jgi:hypothetical protein